MIYGVIVAFIFTAFLYNAYVLHKLRRNLKAGDMVNFFYMDDIKAGKVKYVGEHFIIIDAEGLGLVQIKNINNIYCHNKGDV